MRRLWKWPRLRLREAWVALRAHPWRVTLIAAPWLLGLLTTVPMLWYEMDRAVRLPERQAAQDALENAAQTMLRRLGRLRGRIFTILQFQRLGGQGGNGKRQTSGTHQTGQDAKRQIPD